MCLISRYRHLWWTCAQVSHVWSSCEERIKPSPSVSARRLWAAPCSIFYNLTTSLRPNDWCLKGQFTLSTTANYADTVISINASPHLLLRPPPPSSLHLPQAMALSLLLQFWCISIAASQRHLQACHATAVSGGRASISIQYVFCCFFSFSSERKTNRLLLFARRQGPQWGGVVQPVTCQIRCRVYIPAHQVLIPRNHVLADNLVYQSCASLLWATTGGLNTNDGAGEAHR